VNATNKALVEITGPEFFKILKLGFGIENMREVVRKRLNNISVSSCEGGHEYIHA
jgi:hypothetical protein